MCVKWAEKHFRIEFNTDLDIKVMLLYNGTPYILVYSLKTSVMHPTSKTHGFIYQNTETLINLLVYCKFGYINLNKNNHFFENRNFVK